jgi:tetratricopeptide (TPR) repeat protein
VSPLLPLVTLALLAGPADPPSPPPPAHKVSASVARALPEPAAARDEARRCEEEGDKDAALAACREALRLGLHEPQRTALRQLLARRLAEEERFDELVAVYQEDTQEHPADSEAWRRLGTALLFLRADPAGALPALQEAVRLRAEDADGHVLLGVCLNGLGRHPEAVAAFEEALRLDPEAFELRPAARASFEAAQRGERWP